MATLVSTLPSSTTQTERDQLRRRVFEHAQRLEIDCFYSSKSHYKVAVFWNAVNLWLGLFSIVLSAAAGITADRHPGTASSTNIPPASLLALSVTVLTAVLTFMKASERASSHRNSGLQYGNMRDRIQIFYSITCIRENDSNELIKQLNAFILEKKTVGEQSAHIPAWAYKKAVRERSKAELIKSQCAYVLPELSSTQTVTSPANKDAKEEQA